MSDAFAINDSGVAVGSSLLSSNARAHATMYANGKAIDLGSLGDDSIAYGINNAGEAVGSYDLAGTNSTIKHAFVYRDGAMLDLNTLIDPAAGWTIDTAIAINDQHQIAATGCNTSGKCQGLLLSLANYSVSPVPEPAAYAALLTGLGLIGIARRRQRSKYGVRLAARYR
jgi:probable HAF family extracellular repeat protein